MNVKRILFPTDFSHYNDAALEFAASLAADAGAILHIVHVDEMQDLSAPLAISGPHDMATDIWDRTWVHEQLDRIAPPIGSVQYTRHYLEGMPVDEIVNFAVSEQIDLIVMASHGRTGLSRLLMGSVAEAVMRKAHCPVLIVKQPGNRVEPASRRRNASSVK